MQLIYRNHITSPPLCPKVVKIPKLWTIYRKHTPGVCQYFKQLQSWFQKYTSYQTPLLAGISVYSLLGRYFWRSRSLLRKCARCRVGCVRTRLCRQNVRSCWEQWRGPPPPSPLRRCLSPQSRWDFLWSVRSAGADTEKRFVNNIYQNQWWLKWYSEL